MSQTTQAARCWRRPLPPRTTATPRGPQHLRASISPLGLARHLYKAAAEALGGWPEMLRKWQKGRAASSARQKPHGLKAPAKTDMLLESTRLTPHPDLPTHRGPSFTAGVCTHLHGWPSPPPHMEPFSQIGPELGRMTGMGGRFLPDTSSLPSMERAKCPSTSLPGPSEPAPARVCSHRGQT